MAEHRQSGTFGCADCEPRFVDLLEGSLPAAEAAGVQRHVDSCPGCKDAMDAAFRGKAWLALLREEDTRLEPPQDLVSRILSRTSSEPITTAGDSAGETAARIPKRQSPWANVNMAAVRGSVWYQPRLVLTAAMAFFSVTLSLSVAGIHATDLKPSNIRHTVTRQYYQANAHVVRYYESLRVVYELESRVRELRRAAEMPQPQQAAPRQNPGRAGKDGSRLRPEPSGPAGMAGRKHSALPETAPRPEEHPDPADLISNGPLEARLVRLPVAPQRSDA